MRTSATRGHVNPGLPEALVLTAQSKSLRLASRDIISRQSRSCRCRHPVHPLDCTWDLACNTVIASRCSLFHAKQIRVQEPCSCLDTPGSWRRSFATGAGLWSELMILPSAPLIRFSAESYRRMCVILDSTLFPRFSACGIRLHLPINRLIITAQSLPAHTRSHALSVSHVSLVDPR